MARDTYNFSELSYQQVEATFQLKRVDALVSMKVWQEKANNQTINDLEQTIMNLGQKELRLSNNTWNEQELQVKFIAPLLLPLGFNQLEKGFAAFSERWLKTKIKHLTFQGKVDWMVAIGRYEPIQPFFFIHEYKRSQEGSGDPVGQLLVTMYVAHLLNHKATTPSLFEPKPINHKDLPIYGCYVIGRWWHFVVLDKQQYVISDTYDAIKPSDLTAIVKLLKAQQQMISEYVDGLGYPLF